MLGFLLFQFRKPFLLFGRFTLHVRLLQSPAGSPGSHFEASLLVMYALVIIFISRNNDLTLPAPPSRFVSFSVFPFPFSIFWRGHFERGAVVTRSRVLNQCSNQVAMPFKMKRWDPFQKTLIIQTYLGSVTQMALTQFGIVGIYHKYLSFKAPQVPNYD